MCNNRLLREDLLILFAARMEFLTVTWQSFPLNVDNLRGLNLRLNKDTYLTTVRKNMGLTQL